MRHPLPLFKEYLNDGYYPFRSDPDFPIELGQVVTRTLEEDIPQYANLSEGRPDIGTVRETFFYNQMRVRNRVTSSAVSDFEIGETTFEVGGRSKTAKQLQGAKDGYVVKDDIEYGYGRIVPLWAFGLNY